MKINRKFLIKTILTITALILQSSIVFAQQADTVAEPVIGPAYYKALAILFFVVIIAIIAAFIYFGTEEIKEKEISGEETGKASLWETIKQAMTKASTPG